MAVEAVAVVLAIRVRLAELASPEAFVTPAQRGMHPAGAARLEGRVRRLRGGCRPGREGEGGDGGEDGGDVLHVKDPSSSDGRLIVAHERLRLNRPIGPYVETRSSRCQGAGRVRNGACTPEGGARQAAVCAPDVPGECGETAGAMP